MTKRTAWIKALRLRTLPLSLSGIVAGSAIAYFNGYWNDSIFFLAILTTILFQILSNLANDLGDSLKGTDNENRVGPERSVQSGLITATEMKNAIVFTSGLCLLSAALLIYYGSQGMSMNIILFYVGLTFICVFAALTYTIGKNAYGYHGLGDLMVLIFFGGVSVLGVYSLYAKSFLFENILLALGIGLLSTAVLNLNNMRDYSNDEKSGKSTLVVKMGPNQAKFYHALLILIALLSFATFINATAEPIIYLSLIPGVYLFLHLRKVMKITNPTHFDPELKKVALTTFSISLLMFIIIIFIK